MFKEVDKAAALKLFKGRDIKVQDAQPAKLPILDDDGKKVGERDGFEVSMRPLSAELVLSAKQHDGGKVTITTIDGKRHEARGTVEAATTDKADK
jgi:hypothetical protein